MERTDGGYKIFTLADSARTKGMWAGALERTSIPGLSGVYVQEDAEGAQKLGIREIPREHTPAVLKIIDEGLVNASDHKKEHETAVKASDRVSRIRMDFDPKSGRFVIENDGPGIDIKLHSKATELSGHDVYLPEVAFAIFLAGRNMDKPPDSVKGGINGLGAKLINVHSTYFAVETVGADASGQLQVYMQIFQDRLRVRKDPKIFSVNSAEAKKLSAERRRPHTRITFEPAYAELGYKGGLSPQDAADIEAWCRWRMHLLAAYVGPKVAVTFNGVKCLTTSAKDLAGLVVTDPEAIIMPCSAKAAEKPYSSHPWDIAVAVVPSSKRFTHVSVINGVYCAKGSHVTYLKKILNEAVGAKLAKAVKAKDKRSSVTDTCKQVCLVLVGALPGADWGGQRKDELQVAEAKLRPYTIAPAVLGKIATAIADNLLCASEKEVRGRKKKVEAEKYTGARRAGTKDSEECALLTGEGDSAIGLLRRGLTLGKKNPGGPTFEHYGVISLGGVIMNAMKKTSEVETANGATVLVRSEQLRNNKILKALVEVLGLDFTCRYSTPEEIKRLRYGSIIICTDQDLDGTGKILPLVLVWFYVFWPNLIRRGFVKRFLTPVIRALPKNKKNALREFYYENEYQKWVDENGGESAVTALYKIKYYKGLGTHDADDVVLMFRNFTKSVYTFTLDDGAAELFEVYFGNQPSLRKVALSTPVAFLTYEESQEIHRSRMIPCSTQLSVDAKAYKLDDIQRKIPSALDGIPVARRKVLAGALSRFAHNNHEIKVFQLGGYIAEHMFYHHGGDSLNATITSMGQRFPGALHYPYLVGKGEYGSRHGDPAASARYIEVKLAAPYAKAMFPAEDTWMLPYVFEDGERAQPKYFVPILPVILLESFEVPSEGWRHKSYARDFGDVLHLLRVYLGAGPQADVALIGRVAAFAEAKPGPLNSTAASSSDLSALRERFPLKVSLSGYGDHLAPEERAELIRSYKGVPHSFGWYCPEHQGNATIIHVRELPLRKTTQSFLSDLEKPTRAKYIDDVDASYCTDDRVDVRIKLRPGAWDEICANFGSTESDAIEEFLLLKQSLKPFLNCYSYEGSVIEFDDDYHAIFFYWVPKRRDMYRSRFERELVITRLKIELERETVRYIEMAHELDLAHKDSEDEACAVLAAHGFKQFDSALLFEPRYTPTDQLEHLVLRGVTVSYNYLLNLKERELLIKARQKREATIIQYEQRLRAVEELLSEKPFAAASVWRAEIDEVVAAIDRGERTNWKF